MTLTSPTRNRPFTIESLLSLPEPHRTAALASLTETEAEALLYDWDFWARDAQLPPLGEWQTWLYMAGRGTGKTRTAAEWIRDREKQGFRRIALVGKTPADVRDTMIEGESGLLAISPPDNQPHYEPSKRRLTWPSGAFALAFSGAEPDQLRGPQFDTAWVDELAAFKYPRDTWDNLLFGLRLGEDPKVVITTTPKPIALLKEISKDSGTVVTRESSYANRMNLTPTFFQHIINRYEGTRTGQQEIYAELLDEAEGALWTRALFEAYRVDAPPLLKKVAIGLDPSGGSSEENDEVGIVVGGLGTDGHGYVLADVSGRYSPNGWATKAIQQLDSLDGDIIVAEVNFGGDMVENTIRTVRRNAPVKKVTASRSKEARAEPVVSLYEQGLIHHVGVFQEMEDECCTWEPGSGMRSPNRLDALVWVFTELMPARKRSQFIYA